MGDYDKIIKENIEAILLALSEKLLGFSIKGPVDLPEKLQATVEREPDFLKKVTLEDNTETILHLEFQTNDELKMVYRMAEYKALLQRKFEIPVKNSLSTWVAVDLKCGLNFSNQNKLRALNSKTFMKCQ